ncbi:expressed unknown protein [Seminavis robusta]|uniref:Uncharacterized protein n=1 Tax=Seminavis robusta TaxID=568900 RepID=A0A9N8DKC1_9STRA|nr:expressed unknown protein [Seminavis robusta]|eukprot:Sro201_g085230.1 n/a (233) ;mRNA; r:81938-82725
MGVCCSAPAAELPAATEEDIKRLREKGHLPCLAGPSVDFDGDNQCQTVYVAEYENGTEITFLFLDEDRPNMCEDCIYDTIRRPLFGRYSDIESFLIIDGAAEFPGTYSGEQKWNEKVPEHGHATVDLSKFEKRDDTDPIVWVNTWNHLIGDKNNNSEMEITYQRPMKAGSVETKESRDFVVRIGSRAEVDARFTGIMTTLSTVVTEERSIRLGKRLNGPKEEGETKTETKAE